MDPSASPSMFVSISGSCVQRRVGECSGAGVGEKVGGGRRATSARGTSGANTGEAAERGDMGVSGEENETVGGVAPLLSCALVNGSSPDDMADSWDSGVSGEDVSMTKSTTGVSPSPSEESSEW